MSRRVFASLIVIGLAARLLLLLTSIGTNDAAFFMLWARLAAKYGVAGSYAHNALLNHPPLSLGIIVSLGRIADTLRVEMTDLMRLMQTVADVGSAACLAAIGRVVRPGQEYKIALLYFLSPVAIMISGFHCNTDPTMVMLVLLAALLHARGNHGMAGIALGLATGIKILPLFLLPLFALCAPRVRFMIGFAVTFAIIFVPVIVIGGAPVVHNIFGYASLPEWWGVPSMLADAAAYLPRAAWSLMSVAVLYVNVARYLELLLVIALAVLFVRRERDAGRLLAFVGLTYIGTLVLAPGAGVQYLLWPLPFLPFVVADRLAIAISAAGSLLIAAMYTSWSGGFPWWYANSMLHPWPYAGLLRTLGYAVWAVLLVAFVAGVLRHAATQKPVSA